MKKEKTNCGKGSFSRAFAGILIAYIIYFVACFLLIWAYAVDMRGEKNAVINWIVSALLVLIIFLYTYGWLGFWQVEMMESRNIIVRIFGKICGYIGFVLRPYPLLAFGPNKKKIFVFFVSLPIAVFGGVFIVLGATKAQILPVPANWKEGWSIFYFILGGVSLFNALQGLLTKKCPNCGCLMSKIDYDFLDYSSEKYSREYSQNVGYVTDGKGNSVDVYQNYSVEHSGSVSKQAKTFTCPRCGTQKQGRAFVIHEMSLDDPRNSLTHH